MSQLVRPGSWIKPVLLLGFATLLLACRPEPGAKSQAQDSNDVLQVVATTTILGDVVQQIGGDLVQVSVLVPPGTDPHSFQPAPSEIRMISDADLVITNGAGLDTFLNRLLESALKPGDQKKMVTASEGIDFRQLPPGIQSTNQGGENSLQPGSLIDPHVWFDPGNVMIWSENIERSLSQTDPDHADRYAANAREYRDELKNLDTWIKAEVAKIPAENRRIVSDHQTLGYFADRYGFKLVGALIPGSSAAAEPSAEDLAALIDSIRAQGVKAIFVGSTVSPVLAQRIAADTGALVVPIYTDSLTPAGGQASSYLNLMHFDINAIVEALQ